MRLTSYPLDMIYSNLPRYYYMSNEWEWLNYYRITIYFR